LAALSEKNELGAAALAPFDKMRSGTLLGEGAGFLVLEDAAAEKQRGATPIARVLGYGASMDAHHPVMPEPSGAGAATAMLAALADAGIAADAVDYINAHGTGTAQNDVMEARAVERVFGARSRALPVSSTKAVTGHMLTAAGVVEAIACLLPLTRQLLPPTLHHRVADPDIPLDVVPNTARPLAARVVMSNSYGLGGQNASLLFGRV